MTKPYSALRNKMSPQAREAAEKKAQQRACQVFCVNAFFCIVMPRAFFLQKV